MIDNFGFTTFMGIQTEPGTRRNTTRRMNMIVFEFYLS